MHDAEILIYKMSVSFLFEKKGGNIMNEVIERENIVIEDMIYEIRGVQVMLSSDVFVTKCNGHMITHYDIGKPISSCNYNFADTFAKLFR